MSLPLKGGEYTLFLCLLDTANPKAFLTTPTIVAGDVKVSIDGGAYADLATTPVVVNSQVQVDLSASEMNGDSITVQFEDQAGAEWLPMRVIIPTI